MSGFFDPDESVGGMTRQELSSFIRSKIEEAGEEENFLATGAVVAADSLTIGGDLELSPEAINTINSIITSDAANPDGGSPSTPISKIQFRRGTAAAWTAANPVLLQGELGYETDTNQFKFGNGSTAWGSLSYFGGGGGAPSGPAGGDLAGTYPNPSLKNTGPGATGPIGDATHTPIVTIDAKGRVTALTSGLITGTVPGGSAGGSLAGTYPNPTIASSVSLPGSPTTTTQTATDSSTKVATTAFVYAAIATGGGGPPSGPAGGDLAGTYPNPTIKANVALTGTPTAVGDFVARIGLSSETGIGAAGPSGQAGVLFAGDTNLYRSSANTLQTDDAFIATFLQSTGTIVVNSADGVPSAGGNELMFGSAWDTRLWRSAANKLDTNADFTARSAAATQAQIGAVGPSSQAGILFGTATDTILWRNASDTLRTDAYLTTTKGLYSNVGLSTQASLDNDGSGRPQLALGSGFDCIFYRNAANQMRTPGDLLVDVNAYAKFGTAAQTKIGTVGPGGEAGIKFGSAGDAYFWRGGAGFIETNSAITVHATGADLLTIGYAGGATDFSEVLVDGTHYWGPGSSGALDTRLYRSAAKILTIDDTVGGAATRIGAVGPGGEAGIKLGSAGPILYNLVTTWVGLSGSISMSPGTNAYAIELYNPPDSDDSFLLSKTGALSWGSGAAAIDTNLYRSAANQLKTDDEFVAADLVAVPASDGAPAFAVYRGNANFKWYVEGSGKFRWSDSINSYDTNLYRSSPYLLKTDNAFAALHVHPTTLTAPATIPNGYYAIQYGTLNLSADLALEGDATLVLTDLQHMEVI